MSRLVLTTDLLAQVKGELLRSSDETCAILFGRAIHRKGQLVRLVVREVQWITETDYGDRSGIKAQLLPTVVAAVAQRARRTGESLIFVHSHPFGLNQFSSTDDVGEKLLYEFFRQRTPGRVHAAMLVTPEVILARVLGREETLQVVGVGPELIWGKESPIRDPQGAFDRQVRIFGEPGQQRLREMRVGIVGLGGTGSIVLEQLAHLGVQRFLLIDPDRVERTNLNRLVGATESDVGAAKVEVAAALAMRINLNTNIETLNASVLVARVAEELAATDFVFCCTDSQGSRAVLNQFAYQYLVPMVDMGVSIVAKNHRIVHIAGRTQMMAPGLGCLMCGNLLNPEVVRVDFLTDFERAVDPYVVGLHEPAPSVISLNATMASIAVTMFLAAAVGVPSHARMINYNGVTSATRAALIPPYPNCIACSHSGALARADEWPLPGRIS